MAGCEGISWFWMMLVMSALSTCVSAVPVILSEPQEISVLVGRDLILECQVQDLGQMPVLWKKGGDTIALNSDVFAPWNTHMLVEEQDRLHDLTISQITLDDEDEYECEVPGAGSVSYTVVVNQPPMLTIEPVGEKVEHLAGTDVTLSCRAEGKPKPTVHWARTDGQPLRSGEMTQEGEDLVLDAVTEDDTGDYLCQASNVAGTVDEIIQLLIQFAPEVTAGTTFVHTGPGDDVSIDCTFHASPEAQVVWSHNGSAIDRDLRTNLNIRREGTEKWILQITDLLPRDLGTYACVGGNSYGSSDEEIELSAFPEGLQITGEPRGDYSDAYTLSWQVGSVAPLQQYQLKLRQISPPSANASEDWDKWQDFTIPANPSSSDVVSDSYTMRGLQANTTYSVLLKAMNEFGESEWTEEFQFTTSDEGKTAPPPTTKPPTPETDKPHTDQISQESKASDPSPELRSTAIAAAAAESQEADPTEAHGDEDVTHGNTPGGAAGTGTLNYWLAVASVVMAAQLIVL